MFLFANYNEGNSFNDRLPCDIEMISNRPRESIGTIMEILAGEITKRYWAEIKQNATERGIGFLITPAEAWKLFIWQNRKCVFTHSLLDFCTFGYRGTASLDRIDNDKSYVANNVQWVLNDINIMRGPLNPQYFQKLCCMVAKKRQP
jgi:hypothetical protein